MVFVPCLVPFSVSGNGGRFVHFIDHHDQLAVDFGDAGDELSEYLTITEWLMTLLFAIRVNICFWLVFEEEYKLDS